MGIEVRGVIGQRLQLQLLHADHLAHQFLFDDSQLVHRHGVHLIPEMLARQIGGREVHQLGQIRRLGPIGKSAFAARGAGTRDHGGYQGLAHCQCIANLHLALRGNGTVDPAGQIEFLHQPVKRCHRTCRNRRDLHRYFVVLLMQLQDIVDATQMSQDANRRFAVFAERFNDAVILNAVRLVGLKGSHQLRIYMIERSLSIVKYRLWK